VGILVKRLCRFHIGAFFFFFLRGVRGFREEHQTPRLGLRKTSAVGKLDGV